MEAAVEAPPVHAVRVVDGAETQAWKDVGGTCEWKHPRTPSVRLLWDVRAAGAVLEFLRTTRVGCISGERVPAEDRWDDTQGEEGGPGPP